MMNLANELAELESSQLVRRAAGDDLAYLFKHALTQETAYQSLLFKKRHAIHHQVAEAYERLYPDRLDENAALLAQHYAEAGDDAKTFAYALRAGDAAARVYAHAEASVYYAQALDALIRLPDTVEHQHQRVDTMVKQVGVSLRTWGPAETLKRLAVAETLARPFVEREGVTREDRLRLGRVQYWQGQALIHHNDTRAAIQQLRQVLKTARAENDPQLLAMPASVIGRTLVVQGQFDQAVSILTDAVKALEQVHDEHEWVLATGFRGVAMTMLGDYAAGNAEAERALAHATELNSLTDIALAQGTLGMVQFFGNPLSPGVAHARTLIETAAKSGDRLYAYTAYGFIAWAEARRDNCADSEKNFAQAQTIAQEIGGRLLFADWFAAARAERALRCGQYEQALALAAEVVDRAQSNPSLFAEGVAERIQGQALALIAPPRLDDAVIHFTNSLAKLQEGGARLEAARTHVAWGKVCVQRGDYVAAREHFEKAGAQFEASSLERELEETHDLIKAITG
jgi:hypothetical protein